MAPQWTLDLQWLRLKSGRLLHRYQVSSLAKTEVFQVENSWGSDEASSAALICPWVMVRDGGTGEGMFQ